MKRRFHFILVLLFLQTGWAASPARPTHAAPADVFVLRRFEWIPAFKSPRTMAPLVPRRYPVASVRAMTMAGGQLWASVRSFNQTNAADGSGHLWVYRDQAGLLEPVPGALRQHTVSALFGQPETLWMGLNGGIAGLDVTQNIIHPFGPAQGMISTNIVGFGTVDTTVVALSRFGLLWGLVPGTTNFTRASAAAPPSDPRNPEVWNHFETSGEWMLAVSSNSVAARHFRSPQWLAMRDELANGSPHLTPPHFTCVVGDGEGGFWVGSDAGLHWVNPESNVIENRFYAPSVTVAGGLGMTVAPGFQPTAAAYDMARERVMQAIRERMRDRARYARANARLQHPVGPLWPTSRIPGGVTALHRDGRFLWVATQDGSSPLRSRVLLMLQSGRRWVGWFPVNAPILCLTTDAQRLWVGTDITRSTGASPVFSADRLALISVPQTQWTKDAIPEEKLAEHLATLPVKERAVLAFFDGDPKKVTELLAPTGEAADDADAESLFLLAFVNDAVGLHQPEALEHYVERLRREHPESIFAELAASVRSARPAPLAAGEYSPASTEQRPTPAAAPHPQPSTGGEPMTLTNQSPAVVSSATAPSTVETILAKRDLGKDGRLNAVEFRLWRGPKADFNAADTNHDGQLDAAEIEKLPTPDPASTH